MSDGAPEGAADDDRHAGGTDGGDTGGGGRLPSTGSEFASYLYGGGIALLAVLAALATFRFYNSASRAVSEFVAPRYEPAFQAAFNLVVVLVALAGISLLLRRVMRE